MEDQNTSSKHDISIALIQKDIEYIKKSVSDVATTLAIMDRNFAKRDELVAIIETLKTINVELTKKASHDDIRSLSVNISEKVEKKEFEPIQKTLNKINWLVISSFIVALLGFLLSNQTK